MMPPTGQPHPGNARARQWRTAGAAQRRGAGARLERKAEGTAAAAEEGALAGDGAAATEAAGTAAAGGVVVVTSIAQRPCFLMALRPMRPFQSFCVLVISFTIRRQGPFSTRR